MTATKPTPHWVIRLLRRCSADEQRAVVEYRGTVGRSHSRHKDGYLSWVQLVKIWSDELGALANSAQGSPELDRYLLDQRRHLENFIKEEAS